MCLGLLKNCTYQFELQLKANFSGHSLTVYSDQEESCSLKDVKIFWSKVN